MRTLAILAHMDDEALSCGGLLARRAARGATSVLTLFNRKYQYGHGEQHAEAQYQQYLQALSCLSVTQHQYHALEEGEPHAQRHYALLQIIEDVLARFQPTEVIIHSADDRNQDHRLLAEVCRIALRPWSLQGVERVLTCLPLDGTIQPANWYCELSPQDYERKVRAIGCYVQEAREGNHPRSRENLHAWHRLAGSQCGAEYAEPYRLILQKDPV